MDKKDLLTYYRAQAVDKERMYAKPFRRYQQRRRLEVVREFAREAGGLGSSPQILDVGCGDGYGSTMVLDGFPYTTFVGLDLSAAKLCVARANLRNSRVVLGDAERLPLSDKCFDMAFSLETLEHLLDPSKALQEISRVLRPGGVFFLSVPVSSSFNAAMGRFWKTWRHRERFREHLQTYTCRSLMELLERSGLRPSSHRYCVFNYPCYEILTRIIPYRMWRRCDQILSSWVPVGILGAKLGLSLAVGNDYLVIRADKPPAG